MGLYLIAGTNSDKVKQALENNGITVVRSEESISEALKFLTNNHLDYHCVLLTDQGVISDYQNFEEILKRFMLVINPDSELKFLTKDPKLEMVFKQIFGRDSKFQVYLSDQVKIPVTTLIEFCKSNNNAIKDNATKDNYINENAPMQQSMDSTVLLKKSWSIFDKFRSKQVEHTGGRNEEKNKAMPVNKKVNEKISLNLKDCKKVVVITGHRGSGVTGTLANIASVASSNNLSVIVVDMDTVYRGINLYFPKFGDEVEIKPELSYSLLRCLMKPESYDVNSCRINENLSVITLSYSATNKEKLAEAMEYKRVLSLVSLLRQKYNLVLLDLPLEIMKYISDIITQVDSIGLCVNNNLYSVINTVKDIEENMCNDLLLFRTKCRVIVSKYNENNKHNGKRFSPEYTCELLNDISGVIKGEYQNCGVIPYTRDFDLQTGSGDRICNTNSDYRNYYVELLKNLL